MTKAELTERLVDRLVDPYTDCLEDYEYVKPIDLEYAKSLLKDLRHEDVEIDDPDYAVPAEVTPEMLMDTFNCILRAKQHELTVQRLADFITENEMVCEYSNYYLPAHPGATDVLPVEFLNNDFPFMNEIYADNPLWLIDLGQRSPEFSSDDEYCWYSEDEDQLFSTDTPFGDEVLDATAFAEYIMSPEGEECREYITEDLMDEADRERVFGKGDE